MFNDVIEINGKLNIIASDKNESVHWTVYELLGMIHFSGWMTIPANTPAWTWLANFTGIPEDKNQQAVLQLHQIRQNYN